MTLALILCSCATQEPQYQYPEKDGYGKYTRDKTPTSERETIFGKGGLDIFGRDKNAGTGGSAGIGVNSFLWRASLDTISFMPLSSADPFGGVIITDWYSPPDTPSERFKVNAFILSKSLRADGIKISAFRQLKDVSNNWSDAPIEKKVATDLENTILTRARQLRMAIQKP